jgi:hypothetical protein
MPVKIPAPAAWKVEIGIADLLDRDRLGERCSVAAQPTVCCLFDPDPKGLVERVIR